MSQSTHVYIGKMPVCGCVVSLASYSYEERQRTARAVADMIKNGLIVECVTIEEYRTMHVAFGCSHGKIISGSVMQASLL